MAAGAEEEADVVEVVKQLEKQAIGNKENEEDGEEGEVRCAAYNPRHM